MGVAATQARRLAEAVGENGGITLTAGAPRGHRRPDAEVGANVSRVSAGTARHVALQQSAAGRGLRVVDVDPGAGHGWDDAPDHVAVEPPAGEEAHLARALAGVVRRHAEAARP